MATVTRRQLLWGIASLKVTVGCLVALCILVVWGTLYQASAGLYAAQQRFFSAWFVRAFGIVPFPALRPIVGLLSLNLLLAIPLRIGWSWAKLDLLFVHAGILALLIGAACTHCLVEEGRVVLYEGQTASHAVVYRQDGRGRTADSTQTGRMELPFTIRLVDFTQHDYRGTAMAAGYTSRLWISRPNLEREAIVSLNRPFRYGSYALYQSSFFRDTVGEATVLAVVRNPARRLANIAGVVMLAGVFLHLGMRVRSAGRARKASTA